MNLIFLKTLLFLSVLFAGIAAVLAIVRTVASLANKKSPNSRIIWYLLLIVSSVWCLRYAVGYFSVYCPNDFITTGLTKYEEIFNSFVHTFQSFSMDEEYTQYISAGKEMMRFLFGENTGWITAYGVYASVLNVLAPICGGAILLDVLQGAFPKVKLFLKRLPFWKTKYYFSELNESALACAKNILKEKYPPFCKPVIVFTDSYTDGENEKSSELLKKAKAIGGICINDDLTHINHRFTAKKEYWLIDETEIDNIKTLAELTNNRHYKSVERTIIRIFYQDDSYTLTERMITEQISERYRSDEKKKPAIIRVRCYQTLVYNLLKEEPLYQPLLGTDTSPALDVAILGNGHIGTEMLLSTYWCGQMYGVPLSVNLISQDDAETACAKINKISGEILESARTNSPLLKVYPDADDHNPPYFTFRYSQSDVDYADISAIKCVDVLNSASQKENTVFSLLDANYFLVALGDDDVNIRTAERLLKAIMIHQKETGVYKKVTITYVVFDSHLCRTLNKFQSKDTTHENIRVKAVGSIDETYRYESIVNKEYMLQRLEKRNGDNQLTFRDWASLGNMMAMSKKPYEFWSTYARDMHYDYKVFSAFREQENPQSDWESWRKDHAEYICEADDPLAEKLAWLEHRRWNAYMRSIGFKHHENKDVVLLKTHNCLVEQHEPGKDPASDHPRGKDFLEKLKENNPNIINYDFYGIIPKDKYEKLLGGK